MSFLPYNEGPAPLRSEPPLDPPEYESDKCACGELLASKAERERETCDACDQMQESIATVLRLAKAAGMTPEEYARFYSL